MSQGNSLENIKICKSYTKVSQSMVDNVYRRNQWTKLNIHLTNRKYLQRVKHDHVICDK